jgi:hypothetical protein
VGTDEHPERGDDPGEAAGERPSGAGGTSYTGRPSKERPEDGGATRDEDRERPDSPEGREQP